ncbi:hypothetical protein [Chamaesiphon sp.]|uniref:hypothetical protein n=1 Tax=Chamaesiphon sp. TaxID=2814140 RepID=UPI0035936B55
MKTTYIWLGILSLLVGGSISNTLAKPLGTRIANPSTKFDPVTALMKNIENPPARKGAAMQVDGVKYDCHATDSYHSKTQTAVDFRCWVIK